VTQPRARDDEEEARAEELGEEANSVRQAWELDTDAVHVAPRRAVNADTIVAQSGEINSDLIYIAQRREQDDVRQSWEHWEQATVGRRGRPNKEKSPGDFEHWLGIDAAPLPKCRPDSPGPDRSDEPSAFSPNRSHLSQVTDDGARVIHHHHHHYYFHGTSPEGMANFLPAHGDDPNVRHHYHYEHLDESPRKLDCTPRKGISPMASHRSGYEAQPALATRTRPSPRIVPTHLRGSRGANSMVACSR
jgi:hypothetical protein